MIDFSHIPGGPQTRPHEDAERVARIRRPYLLEITSRPSALRATTWSCVSARAPDRRPKRAHHMHKWLQMGGRWAHTAVEPRKYRRIETVGRRQPKLAIWHGKQDDRHTWAFIQERSSGCSGLN
jgi:hypothetical protein